MTFKIIDCRSNKKPRLSVVMSVYNSVSFLEHSIKSILSQTFKNLEFIILNDGSTDDSHKIILNFLKKNNNIVYIKSKFNLGLPKMLNIGISFSRGEFIARQDADDISLKKRMSIQIDFLEKHKNIDLISSNSLNICKNIKIVKKKTDLPSSDLEIKKNLFKFNPINHPAVMVRSQFFNKFGFYKENFKKCQDYEFWLRIKNKCIFSNVKSVLIIRNLNKNSFSLKSLYYSIFARFSNTKNCKEIYQSIFYSFVDLVYYFLKKIKLNN